MIIILKRVMLNKLTIKVILIFLLLGVNKTHSAPEKIELINQNWPFNGVFGRFDKSSLQRGFIQIRKACTKQYLFTEVSILVIILVIDDH